ncbi:MAG: hypothetical protein AAFV07_15580, partial [Bacteroidota bacterium]
MKACFCWLLMLLPALLFGQSESYYAGSDLTLLSPDLTRLIVFSNDLGVLPTLKNGVSVDEYVEAETYILLTLPGILSGDLPTVLDLVFQDTTQIGPSSWGYQIGGNFPLWPHREVLYQPAPGVSLPALDNKLQQANATILPVKGSYRVQFDDPIQAFSLARTLVEEGWCTWAHPDFIAKPSLCDPYYTDQFSLNNTGQTIDGITG